MPRELPAEVSGYVSRGEIPVSILLKRDEGTLHLLHRSDVWRQIQAFVPKCSSAFDSNKTLMQTAYYRQARDDHMKEFINITKAFPHICIIGPGNEQRWQTLDFDKNV